MLSILSHSLKSTRGYLHVSCIDCLNKQQKKTKPNCLPHKNKMRNEMGTHTHVNIKKTFQSSLDQSYVYLKVQLAWEETSRVPLSLNFNSRVPAGKQGIFIKKL